jgi:hypothetical protein
VLVCTVHPQAKVRRSPLNRDDDFSWLTRFEATSTQSLVTSICPSFVRRLFVLSLTLPILIAAEIVLEPSRMVDAPIPGPNVIDWEVDGSTGPVGSWIGSPGSTIVDMLRDVLYMRFVLIPIL